MDNITYLSPRELCELDTLTLADHYIEYIKFAERNTSNNVEYFAYISFINDLLASREIPKEYSDVADDEGDVYLNKDVCFHWVTWRGMGN